MEQRKSVLILGGSGQAGSGTATTLREWHPELRFTIAGRDLGRAQRVADELGDADAVTIDLARGDLGLPPDGRYSAVIAAVWDRSLNGLRYAQDHGLPYLSISSGLIEIAPEVVASGQRAGAAPVVLASHWYAGLLVPAVLDLAEDFARLDTIRVSSLLDELDSGGPAGMEDLLRMEAASSAGLIRRDGVFTWVDGSDAEAKVRSVDGTMLPGQAVAILDVPSLGLATGAPNVRFDFAIGESSSRRRGEPASTEIRIDLAGIDATGAARATSHYVVHPKGQRPLTALGIALSAERMLGLRGEAVAPGIHTPEALIDPAYAVERMVEIGTSVVSVPHDR